MDRVRLASAPASELPDIGWATDQRHDGQGGLSGRDAGRKEAVQVIDMNCSFGRRVSRDARYALPALLRDLDEHGVAAACAYSQQGVWCDPRAGNRETLAASRANPQIIPVATLDPRDTPGWEHELRQCVEAGVRLFRFFPAEQHWSPGSYRFRTVLRRLSECDGILVLSAAAPDPWEYAGRYAELAAEHGLTLILTDTSYHTMSEVMAVMQAFPNVYAETNWLANVAAVQTMVETVGAERLLYGSAGPERPMQKALNQVLEAHISAAAKQAILGLNARSLLRIPESCFAGRRQLVDLEPRRFAEPAFDVHAHLGYWFFPNPDEDYDPSNLLRRMRRYGITHSVLSSYESMRYDLAAGNRKIVEAIDGHPELLAYVELDPHDLALSCAEMDRYYALPNVVGCEVELTHIPAPTGGEKVRALMAEIAKRGKPVLLKPAGADATAERALGRTHPELSIIHAHGFGREWALEVADTPNIHVEFNYSRPSHHDIRDCLDVLGPERLLFGTDQTLLSVGASVGLYLDAGMAAEERQMILQDNARRIFAIE